MKYTYKYHSQVACLYIVADDNYLLSVKFCLKDEKVENIKNKIIEETIKQLDEYFNLKRISFNLPLNPKGTEFQKRVWEELEKIPYGETRTYKEIAIATGNKNACRAVGNANNKNPIAIIIPCHRVIGSNKKLTGYAAGLDIKQKLLEIERCYLS